MKNDDFKTVVYRSGDGRTWQSCTTLRGTPKRGAMEPGLIELKDGRVLQINRTQTGRIWHYYSRDGGDTWTEASPRSFEAPKAPSTLARNPATGALLLVWNPTVVWSDPERTVLGTNHGGPRTLQLLPFACARKTPLAQSPERAARLVRTLNIASPCPKSIRYRP